MGIKERLHTLTLTPLVEAASDEADRLRLLVHAVDEYAIFLLAPDGTVMTWNPGAERLKGYAGPDIVGRHFRVFYPPGDVAAGKPERELDLAERDGVYIDSGWRVRKDGTRFWAHVVITALTDGPTLRGFAKVTRDDTAARAELETGRAIGAITGALLANAGVDAVLALLTAHARHLTGAGRTWLVTPVGNGFTVWAADGPLPGPHAGELLPEDPIVAGVMTLGEPVFVADLAGSCPQLPGREALGAGLLVPMVAGTGITGVLVAAAPSGRSPFGQFDLELLQKFADQATLVLSYELAQQALRTQQVADDRERIARDLHDEVIQQLFGTALGLQSAAGRTSDDATRARIDEAVDYLDVTIRQIRTTIFDLHQSELSSPDSVRAHIAGLVRDAARSLTFQPLLRFDGSIDILITPSTCEHLLAALREMLSNVARHAKASAATVTLFVGSEIVLTVADNGSGPPADVQTGNGLRNLRARARALNGTFCLKGVSPQGSIATLQIPLADHAATITV